MLSLLKRPIGVTLILLAGFVMGCNSAPTPKEQSTIVADTTASKKANGWQEVPTQDGGVMKGEVRDGERVGQWTAYFPNGAVRSQRTYANGLTEGVTEVFYEDGSLYYTGQYRAGKSVGEWRFFDQQGTLIRTAVHDSLGNLLEQR
jgi:hypothetical protein